MKVHRLFSLFCLILILATACGQAPQPETPIVSGLTTSTLPAAPAGTAIPPDTIASGETIPARVIEPPAYPRRTGCRPAKPGF